MATPSPDAHSDSKGPDGPNTPGDKATKDLIARVKKDLPTWYTTDMLSPDVLYVNSSPKKVEHKTISLWNSRFIEQEGMWFYADDNGGLKQFWASQARVLEHRWRKGDRECCLLSPNYTSNTHVDGWRSIVHTVNFAEATMTNEMDQTIRTILRLEKGTPVSLLAQPDAEDEYHNVNGGATGSKSSERTV